MGKSRFLSIVFYIILIFIFISSCSNGLIVQVPAKKFDMKTQSIDSEHGYSAIGVWSLHIDDLTGFVQ